MRGMDGTCIIKKEWKEKYMEENDKKNGFWSIKSTNWWVVTFLVVLMQNKIVFNYQDQLLFTTSYLKDPE